MSDEQLQDQERDTANYERQIEDLHGQLREARADIDAFRSLYNEQTQFIAFLEEAFHCAVRSGYEQNQVFRLLKELVSRQAQRNDMPF